MAMQGPLAPWAPGMTEKLTTLGYTPRLVERQLHLAGGLSKFLRRRGGGRDGRRRRWARMWPRCAGG